MNCEEFELIGLGLERESATNGEELRGLDMVPLWSSGFRRVRDPRRTPLQGDSRAAQNQNGGFRMH